MKSISSLVSAILLFAGLLAGCNGPTKQVQLLQQQIDSLQLRSNNNYKPGMGELMSSIQLHHAKLWFAGENQNWLLAAYNQSLIRSAFKRIQLYHGETFEAKAAYMIDPSMDSVRNAIAQKDRLAFESGFRFLTASCNNCHTVTKHAFNVITIPVNPPVGNQDFRATVQKLLTIK